MAYRSLENLHQLYDGYCQAFSVAGRSLLLVQDQGVARVLINRCPHMDARMDSGTVANGNIRCPVHGIEFNLQTGIAIGPLAHCLTQLEQLTVCYEGSTVGVDI